MEEEEKQSTAIWQEYEQGKSYLHNRGYYNQLKRNNDFYQGEHWKSLKVTEDFKNSSPMPTDNFITTICKHKIGMVAQNNMAIEYTCDNFSKEDLMSTDGAIRFREIAEETVEKINKIAGRFLETNNLENDIWDYDEENCVSGNVGIYIYEDDENIKRADMVYGNNYFLSDENEKDIQKQKYIIIAFRRAISEIREEAKKNGLSEDQAKLIVADNNINEQIGNDQELKNDDGKVLCLLKLYKKKTKIKTKKTIINDLGMSEEIDDEETKTTVYMTKSTQNIVYVPETNLGLTLYPFAVNTWISEKNSARGKGEPQDKISNQIEVNKTLMRRAIAIQMMAYPKRAYLKGAVTNPDALKQVGVDIAIEGDSVADWSSVIGTIPSAQTNPDAKTFSDEISQKTKDNASSGEAALGMSNPEKTSGRAVIAIRDAAAIPISIHIVRKKQFYEDIGRILFDFMQNVDVDGQTVITTTIGEDGKENVTFEEIPFELLNKLKVAVKINVAKVDPYSILASEQSWDALFETGKIDMEEWVSGLNEASNRNKKKLEEMLRKRKEKQREIADIQAQLKERQALMEGTMQDIQNTDEIDNIEQDVINQQQQIMMGG